MKDIKKEVNHEFEFVDINGQQFQRIFTKVIRVCKNHPFATEKSLIEITIKKSGKKVKRCLHCEREKLENKQIKSAEWKVEKDNLTDKYIEKVLKADGKLKLDNIPSQLIEAKRAVIQLKTFTDKINAPLKECLHHGKCYRDDVIKNGLYANGETKWKCKRCMKELHAKNYQLNKVKILARNKQVRLDYPGKVRKIKYKSWVKNKKKYLARDNERRRKFKLLNIDHYKKIDKERVLNLTDSYVKKAIMNRSNLKSNDIPNCLVQVKRATMLLKRSLKSKFSDLKLNNKLEEDSSG